MFTGSLNEQWDRIKDDTFVLCKAFDVTGLPTIPTVLCLQYQPIVTLNEFFFFFEVIVQALHSTHLPFFQIHIMVLAV